MQLRDYQLKALTAVEAGWGRFRRQVVVAPTGSGKTLMFSAICKNVKDGGGRALILCHRDELISQAVAKLHAATGIAGDVEKADRRASLHSAVVVGSIQSLQGKRLEGWPADHFHTVIVDECHHSVADSWQTTLSRFDGHARIAAFTATPDRVDRKNLGQYYENIAFEISLFDLINQGYLSRICVQSIPLQIDLRGVKQTNGDFDATQSANAIEPYMERIADAICEHAPFRRTLGFASLISTCEKFSGFCQRAGLRSEFVYGEDPQRRYKCDAFRAGEYDILWNAGLLGEGYDDPGIDCVANLRPTRSRSLYAQYVGRGTRIAPGKQNLLLLDFLWLHETHNLIRPAHLVAESDDVAEAITALARSKSESGSSQEELDLEVLNTEAQAQREAKLAEELKKKEKKKARVIDAMEFCLSLHEVGVADYQPSTKWESAPVSSGQAETLSKFGFDVDGIKNAGHASKILDLVISRSKLNLATPKQIKYLRQLGHPNPHAATFEQASKYLDQRWKKKASEPRSGELVAA